MQHRVRGAVLGTIAALVVPRVAASDDAKGGAAATPTAGAPSSDAPDDTDNTSAGTDNGVAVPPVERVAPEAPPASDPPKVTWEPFAYLRLQYRMVRNDPNVSFIGRDDGFELQNARLGVRGRLATRFRYRLAFDGAFDEREQLNVPQGRLRVALRDAFVDAVVSGDLVVRAGYFKTLFDPDLADQYEDTDRAFVDRPLESRGVRATDGYQTPGLPPGRSIGAALRLEPDVTKKSGGRLGFELAVQNGGEPTSSNNDNDVPAVSASVFARLANEGWLVASARFNRRTAGELPFRRDEDDLQGAFGARLPVGPIGLGAGVVFVRTMFPTTGGPVENSYGAHAQLTLKIPGSRPVSIGYRFGILDASSLILTDRVIEHTAAAVIGVPEIRVRFQLQFVHAQEQGARALTNDRAQLAAELSL